MKLHNEDCIEQMQKMIDEGVQVDSVVTDPPYELGFMGKSWDSTGIAFQKETWELAFQLLKPGGHLLAFAGSRTYHRIAVAVEDAGFEIRDQIMWLYGSGFPKSLNIGKKIDEMQGWGTALKPAHEPVVMARKPLEGTVAENVLKHGTGGINIDGCRIGTEERTYDIKGGENLNKLSREGKGDSEDARGCGDYGTGAKQKSIGKTTVQGRFPANVMHDGSEEVLEGFPETKSGKLPSHQVSRTIKNTYGKTGWKQTDDTDRVWGNDEGSAARFFYCPKVSKNERNRGLDKNNHPTVKPVELMKYLCRLVTPKGGTVLDPFMGSGSTGMAAKDGGFDFIGIEKEKEYYEIAEQRINITSPLLEFL